MEIIDIYKSFEGSFRELLSLFEEELKQIIKNRILEYQIEEFKRNIETKTFIHRVIPINLYDIYVHLDLDLIVNDFYPTKDRLIETNSIKNIFTSSNCISIIGTAGSGKSTLIKHLLVNSIHTKFKIPIKIELRYLNNYHSNLIHYLKEIVFKINKLASSDRIIERLLSKGIFVIFFDGFDELILEKKIGIQKDIEDIVKLYSLNKYILTSRPFSNAESLNYFTAYSIKSLSKDQINIFIHKQFQNSKPDLAENIIANIKKPQNFQYLAFLDNPLLLSMFLITYQTRSNIPSIRTTFFWQVFETLYTLHDSIEKSSFEREKRTKLSQENILLILEKFSFISLREGKLYFDKVYLFEKFDYLKLNKKLDFNNEDLIYDLTSAICILIQEGLDYTFPHRSLQEYFGALFISKLSIEIKVKFYDAILNNLTQLNNKKDFYFWNVYSLLFELDYRSIIELVIIEFFYWLKGEFISIADVEPQNGFLHLYTLLKPCYIDFYNKHYSHIQVPETSYIFRNIGNNTISNSKNFKDELNYSISNITLVISNFISEIERINKTDLEILQFE